MRTTFGQAWRVRPFRAALLCAGLLAAGIPGWALAQTPAAVQDARPEYARLKARVGDRFQVLITRQSVVLVPRAAVKGVSNIELTDGTVLMDGNPVTGAELRAAIGADAELVMQLSFLDAAARKRLFETPKAPPAAVAVPGGSQGARPAGEDETAPRTDSEDWTVTSVSGRRNGGTRLRVGGDVRVGETEEVRNDVVVVVGSAYIDGRVDGEVVVVGGSIHLGPKADVRGGVTSVGGGVERAAGSKVGGELNDVRLTLPSVRPYFRASPFRGWSSFASPFGSSVSLFGTLIRLGILGLLAAMIVVVFPSKVERVSAIVAAEPWRAAMAGLAAQILFVPLLVLTVVVLAVSIIGIPLLLLVPFVLVALLAATLLGFSGVGCAIGGRFGSASAGGAGRLIVSLAVGLAIIWSLTLIARFVGLAGAPFAFLVSGLLVVGFVIEYVAWTVGLGGVLLSRFGRQQS